MNRNRSLIVIAVLLSAGVITFFAFLLVVLTTAP